MNHIGLFEGIGGFSEAVELMGWQTIAWCEWNEFGQIILNDKYPNAKQHGDITKTDFTIYRGQCDILTGGFPCQPYSLAGKRKGKDDYRHLWPEMLRAIREIQPRWVVGENVFGIVNWNGGLVFDEVQADLEAEGYETIPFILPACAVNAPHRRDRVWFVAYSDRKSRQQRTKRESKKCGQKWESIWGNYNTISESKATTNTHHNGLYGPENRQSDIKGNDYNKAGDDAVKQLAGCGSEAAGKIITNAKNNRHEQSREAWNRGAGFENTSISDYWKDFPTQSPVCDGNDGFSTDTLRQRIREDSMGYLSEKEIDKILSKANTKWREETIKAGGNAIVPQVFLQICKAIEQYENLTNIQ